MVVDEAMIALKCRASLRHYIRGKPHPYGIKAFVFADSATGYVQRRKVYFSVETDFLSDSSLLYITQVVLTLTQLLEGLGYHTLHFSRVGNGAGSQRSSLHKDSTGQP